MKITNVFLTLVLTSIVSLVLFSGCRVYHTHQFDRPCVEVPDDFLNDPETGVGNISEWWKEFEQPELNGYMDEALDDNLSLKQAWSRLAQSRASACIANSARYPEVNVEALTEYKHDINNRSGLDVDYLLYILKPTFSYEVDLWRRIDSTVKAADLNYCATLEDLEATALLLTGRVTDVWFTIQEQKSLLDLINYQVDVSHTLLELVELRFALGVSSALDVYQQRLQLEETKSTLIPVQALLKTASHQLSILLGKAPQEYLDTEIGINAISLPDFPYIGVPCELILRRPDLRSAHYKLRSADYAVAAAVADLFPRITLPSSEELRTRKWGDFWQEEITRIGARLVQPIIDGCRRRCEVQRRKAIVKERLDSFGQIFLIAMGEVEDAIVNEDAQINLLNQIEKEVEIARLNLDEARVRNANGLNDYLTVIAAIQSLQRLERRLIVEHKRLLTTRANLYRALGGPCLVGCTGRDNSCGSCADSGESCEKECNFENTGEEW
jgi:NodT family efflux transporter outer membrane factor (OMF) lipoprotein